MRIDLIYEYVLETDGQSKAIEATITAKVNGNTYTGPYVYGGMHSSVVPKPKKITLFSERIKLGNKYRDAVFYSEIYQLGMSNHSTLFFIIMGEIQETYDVLIPGDVDNVFWQDLRWGPENIDVLPLTMEGEPKAYTVEKGRVVRDASTDKTYIFDHDLITEDARWNSTQGPYLAREWLAQ